MLNEDSINEINKALALAYAVSILGNIGYKKIMKELDKESDPYLRSYFRSLFNEAIKLMREENIPIKK